MNRGSLRWAVLEASLDPDLGHEQTGHRPVVVVSCEPFHALGLATVVPVTSARTSARFPGDVPLPAGEGRLQPGVIVCSQLRTVSLRRLQVTRRPRSYLTSPAVRARVRHALAHQLALDLSTVADGASGRWRYAAST